jgi:hypothetical protein
MTGWLETIAVTVGQTVFDVLPIVGILAVFQLAVIRRPIPNLPRVIVGFAYVLVGLGLFLVGLEKALFPLGRIMASQLTAPEFTGTIADGVVRWKDYLWVYAFAAAIGFATTVAEPSLIAVGLKAEEVSGGTIRAAGLRIAVAVGVACGVALGTLRIVVGVPLPWLIMAGYGVVIVQTLLAPRAIIPLAYDSGGVTTSTVTVPLVAALGLGLATAIPGRSPLLDGFGLIALASLFPMITVMGYAQIGALLSWRARRQREDPNEPQEAS